jgi:GNAT superfamily N-acetyltransferase
MGALDRPRALNSIGNTQKDSNHEQTQHIKAELFDSSQTDWEEIKDQILGLLVLNWGAQSLEDPDFTPKIMEEMFRNPENINVLIRALDGKIIGYSSAVPDEEIEQAAYIYSTDIHPDYQRKKLVSKIMEMMEAEMRRRGYQLITRDSAINNGYADAIERYYEDRIIEKKDHDSPYGPQRYFKIKL